MKYLLVLITLLSSLAYANLNNQDAVYQGRWQNLLNNPGFENGTYEWTPSNTANLSLDTLTPAFGSRSAIWDPSASAETLQTTAITQPKGFTGKQCMGLVNYRYMGASSSDITYSVRMNGSSVLAAGSLLSGSSNFIDGFVEFDCPNSAAATLQLLFTSTVTTAGSLLLDNAYIGPRAINNPVPRFGHFQYVDNDAGGSVCAWDFDSTTFIAVATGDADCHFVTKLNQNIGRVVAKLSGAGAELPAIIWTPLATGTYRVCMSFPALGSSAGDAAAFKLLEQRGNTEISTQSAAMRADVDVFIDLCGYLNVTDLTEREIIINVKEGNSGAVSIRGQDVGTAGAAAGVNWTLEKVY